MTRAIPMLDDLALDAVTWVRQSTRQRVLSLPVAGLMGDIQQRLGRASYEVELTGTLVGEGAPDALHDLQNKAKSGEEVTFTADITSALELDKVVIVSAVFEASAGRPNRYEYRLHLRESPPLPEPASLSPFGGLEGLELRFDTDVLGDIADMAGELQGAIDAVTSALGALDALAGLKDLGAGNPLEPIQSRAGSLSDAGRGAGDAATALSGLMGGS